MTSWTISFVDQPEVKVAEDCKIVCSGQLLRTEISLDKTTNQVVYYPIIRVKEITGLYAIGDKDEKGHGEGGDRAPSARVELQE